MRQPNGCSTPAPKSSAANQWVKEELAEKRRQSETNPANCYSFEL